MKGSILGYRYSDTRNFKKNETHCHVFDELWLEKPG
jgi:hypothetical protein